MQPLFKRLVTRRWVMTARDRITFSSSVLSTNEIQGGVDHSVWKLLKMSHLIFLISAFSTNFWPIKTDLSGNSVWPQASNFQKLAKLDHFWHFLWTFVHSKSKRSSLRSQCWMRLFLWFQPLCVKFLEWMTAFYLGASNFFSFSSCIGEKNGPLQIAWHGQFANMGPCPTVEVMAFHWSLTTTTLRRSGWALSLCLHFMDTWAKAWLLHYSTEAQLSFS